MKNELELIKKEFENDEKILESAFKLERFFKKYKVLLISLVVVILAWISFVVIYDYLEEKRTDEISAIFNELNESPNNENLRNELKKLNPELYDLFLFSLNELDEKDALESKNELIKILATYDNASKNKDFDKLTSVAKDTNLGEFSILQAAFLARENNDFKKMRELLKEVKNAELQEFVKAMQHYGILIEKAESNSISFEKVESKWDIS